MTYFQCSLKVEEDCHGEDSTTGMSYFTVSIAILLMLLNIPGNLLIILAVVLDPFKKLRTPFNFMMVNLAVADLIVGTVTEPLSIYIHWKEGVGDHVTLTVSRVFFMSYFISCTASLLSLAILAVERYLAFRHPYIYRNKLTKRRVLFIAIGVWTISIALSCIYLQVGYVTYAFIFVNTAVAITIAIICFMYYLMYRALKTRGRSDTSETILERSLEQENNIQESHCDETSVRHQKNDGEKNCVENGTTLPTSYSQNSVDDEEVVSGLSVDSYQITTEVVNVISRQNSAENLENQQSQLSAKIEQRMTRRFLVVLLALVLCYGPGTIITYVMTFCRSCGCVTLHWLRDLQFLVIIANSSVNFFAYALRSSRFRKAIGKILKIKTIEGSLGSNAKITDSSTDIMNL